MKPSRIVVIADDLTGATELAGAALARGLSAEVQTHFNPTSQAGVLALDTGTRSLSPEEAARRAGAAAEAVLRAGSAWVYKKTDSVLRGQVRVELEAILRAGPWSDCLLVPANPSRSRVIRRGEYFVQGMPLDETPFARDPEHPRRSARVAELLGDSPSIRVPDTATLTDVAAHAASAGPTTLTAGGVDFFSALLAARVPVSAASGTRNDAPPRPLSPTLFVCGSAVAWQQGRTRLQEQFALKPLTLPALLWRREVDAQSTADWTAATLRVLREHGVAMLAIGDAPADADGPAPSELARRLARTAARVVAELERGRLCVEGGATARAVIDELGWTRLDAVREWAPGTVELRPRAGRFALVCKVGSYVWPEPLLTAIPKPSPFAGLVEQPIDGVLDLHTFQPGDLGELLPEYLEQCRARGLLEVRLIHGKGTGALRRGVTALLGRLACVAEVLPAGPRFGGAGALIVRLRAPGRERG